MLLMEREGDRRMRSRRLGSFRKGFWQFTLPMLIPLLTLATFSIIITQNYIKAKLDTNNEYSLSLAQNSMEMLISETNSISINFNLNASFILGLKSLLEHSEPNPESAPTKSAYMNLVNTAANAKPYVESVYLYFNNSEGSFLVSNQGIMNIRDYIDNSWFQTFKNMPAGEEIKVEKRDITRYYFEQDKLPVITVYRKFYMPGQRGERDTGVVIVNIKCRYVEDMLRDYQSMDRQVIAIFDAAGDLIAESAKSMAEALPVAELTAAEVSDANRYIISKSYSEKYDVQFMSIVSKADLYRLPIQLVGITVILSVFSCLIGGVLAYKFYKKNYNNLLGIIDIFERAETGKPLPLLPNTPSADEYDYILRNIIKTFVEQHYLKVQLSEKKYHLQVMELLALQSQINPHFLSNTLKTIFWMTTSLTGKPNDASKMIENLTSILTYLLDEPQKFVLLKDEIAYTESYVEIQKMRYKDKIHVVWQYDESITDVKVMKLLFQPFIENSIYHGIKEKPGSGLVSIHMKLRRGRLCVALFDDGIGMSREKLQKLKETLHLNEESDAHIGLRNTYKRLGIMYGSETRFRIKSKQGRGTAIFFSFPVQHLCFEGFPENVQTIDMKCQDKPIECL